MSSAGSGLGFFLSRRAQAGFAPSASACSFIDAAPCRTRRVRSRLRWREKMNSIPSRIDDCGSALLAGESVRCDKRDTAFLKPTETVAHGRHFSAERFQAKACPGLDPG